MKIEFDPPKALVPEKWDLLFDHEKQQDMTTEYKSAMETLSQEAFQINFIKNSDEKDQSDFSAIIE